MPYSDYPTEVLQPAAKKYILISSVNPYAREADTNAFSTAAGR